jgi:hypothetical protein
MIGQRPTHRLTLLATRLIGGALCRQYRPRRFAWFMLSSQELAISQRTAINRATASGQLRIAAISLGGCTPGFARPHCCASAIGSVDRRSRISPGSVN